MGSCKEFVSAVAVYLASYYVFNFDVPKLLEKDFAILSESPFEHTGQFKDSQTVLSMLDKLTQHLWLSRPGSYRTVSYIYLFNIINSYRSETIWWQD